MVVILLSYSVASSREKDVLGQLLRAYPAGAAAHTMIIASRKGQRHTTVHAHVRTRLPRTLHTGYARVGWGGWYE